MAVLSDPKAEKRRLAIVASWSPVERILRAQGITWPATIRAAERRDRRLKRREEVLRRVREFDRLFSDAILAIGSECGAC